MAAMSLLDYVQTIASSLDEDEVNSHSDTVVSLQIAQVVKTAWTQIQNRADLPEHYNIFELTASDTPSYPVIMYRPENVDSIEWVKYNTFTADNTNPLWKIIKFLPLDQFLIRMHNLQTTSAEVLTFQFPTGMDSDAIEIIYRNDIAPEYYTTFNDQTLIFDSFDAEVDDTLQKNKSLAYGHVETTFIMSDAFIPFQDADLSTLLLNEAKILAFAELKQVGHDVAKEWAMRSWTKLNKGKRGVDQNRDELSRAPNFGRK